MNSSLVYQTLYQLTTLISLTFYNFLMKRNILSFKNIPLYFQWHVCVCVHILSDIKIAGSMLLIFFYMCGCFSCMYVCVPRSCMVYKKYRRRCQIWGWSYSWLQAWCVHARYEPVTCGRAASTLNFWVISVDLIDQYSLTSRFSCPVHSVEKFCTSEIASCLLESRTQFIYFQYLLSVAFLKIQERVLVILLNLTFCQQAQ